MKRTRQPMTRGQKRAAGITSIAVSLLMSCFPASGMCAPPQDAPLVAAGTNVHLTLKGREGLERLVLYRTSTDLSSSGELHLSGHSRGRGSRPDSLATLSISGKRAWVFFSGHRTGRPAAATLSLTRVGPRIQSAVTKVSRAANTPFRCGSEASGDGGTPSGRSLEATSNLASKTLSTRSIRPFSPPRVIEIATLADYDFFLVHGRDSNAYIRAVLNATQELYTKQLGLTFKITQQEVETSGTPASREASSETLLESFRGSGLGATSHADVRHLFTGKRLDGLTIGIAYIAAACTAHGLYSVGISRGVSDALQPLLAAHEIGHNLSAVHAAGARSIMNPSLTTANDLFLNSSIAEITDFVSTTGSCLTPASLTQPTLRVSPLLGSRFSASVKFATTRPQSCQTTLLGSEDGKNFISLATKTTKRPRVNKVSTVTFKAASPPLDSPHTFYFKTRVTCAGKRGRSAPQSLTYHPAPGNTLVISEGGRWLSQLRANLR